MPTKVGAPLGGSDVFMGLEMFRAVARGSRTICAVPEIRIGIAEIGDSTNHAAMKRLLFEFCLCKATSLPLHMTSACGHLFFDVLKEKDQEIQDRCQNQKTLNILPKDQCVCIEKPGNQSQPFYFDG